MRRVLSRIKGLNVPVEIGLADEEGFPHVGQLDFVDNQIDPDTGTIYARGRFHNARYLTPGMFVRVRLPIGRPHQALWSASGRSAPTKDRSSC